MSMIKNQNALSGHRSNADALLRKARKSNDPVKLLRVQKLAKTAQKAPKSGNRPKMQRTIKTDIYYERYY